MDNIIYQVDAFTNATFKGNPAGVYISPNAQDDTWMQNMAREMNLSETAFLVPKDDGYSLRWFTPAIEVDLC
ncbi:MAG TPA: PhzF family phenazine biosynthesis protein, partial [Leptolinea sp.]